MPTARRTVRDIMQDAVAEIGIQGSVSLIEANTGEAAMQRTILRRVGLECCRAGLLVEEYSFYTANGTASYPLPSDYYLPWTGTSWNRTDQWSMRHIPQIEWQANKSGFTASSVHQRYRVMPALGGYSAAGAVSAADQWTNRRFHIDPTPDSAEQVVFNYRSNHWIEDIGESTEDTVDGVTLSGSNEVQIDATSHSVLAGEVVGFYGVGGTTELNGRIFTVSTVDTNDFTLQGTSAADFTAWTSGGAFYKLGEEASSSGEYSRLPDDLLEVGITARMRQRMGLPYFEHHEEFQRLLSFYRGAMHGERRVRLGGGGPLFNRTGIPEGNFPSS